MENAIIIAVILIVVVLAGLYIYKAKKSGKKCIGCPEGCTCNSQNENSTSCGCGCYDETK